MTRNYGLGLHQDSLEYFAAEDWRGKSGVAARLPRQTGRNPLLHDLAVTDRGVFGGGERTRAPQQHTGINDHERVPRSKLIK